MTDAIRWGVFVSIIFSMVMVVTVWLFGQGLTGADPDRPKVFQIPGTNCIDVSAWTGIKDSRLCIDMPVCDATEPGR